MIIYSSWLHHHSSSNGIQGVWDNTGTSCDGLGNDELNEDVVHSWEGEDNLLGSIVSSKIESSVDDDSDDWDTKSLVESLNSVSLVDSGNAVNESVEFSVWLSDIGSESSSGEVQGVNEQWWGGSGSSSTQDVSDEE